jgi:hypothetical protein
MVDHKHTSKADMIAAFPEIVEMIQGEPTMRDFLRVLQHLMVCAESHDYSNSKLNFLHVCLDANLYGLHTTDPYPKTYIYPGDTCDYTGLTEGDTIGKVTRYAEWQCWMKWHLDGNTMSSSLIHRFLSLMQTQYKTAFLSIHIANPKMEFQACFKWFIDQYGACTEQDRINNKELMKREWNPIDGFESLITQILEGITYANFAGSPMSDRDIVDIATQVIMRCGLLAEPYIKWHERA